MSVHEASAPPSTAAATTENGQGVIKQGYLCDMCDEKNISSLVSLLAHFAQVHNVEIPTREIPLSSTRMVAGDGEGHVCEECSAKFAKMSSLKTHLKHNHGYDNEQCELVEFEDVAAANSGSSSSIANTPSPAIKEKEEDEDETSGSESKKDAVAPFYCEACDAKIFTQSGYNKHLKRPRHLENLASEKQVKVGE